jgi:hypothetical protein
MKKHLLLFLFALICNALCSQDLIIAENRDSINCQILAIDDGKIHFNTAAERAKIISLPLEQVQSFSFGYYPNTQPDYSYRYKKKSDYARFRVAIAGGYSYRTIGLPSGVSGEVKDFYRKANDGFNYGVEFNYYFNKFIGMGMNYYASRFNPGSGNPEWNYRISPKTRMQQVTPTVNFRVYNRKKTGAFIAGVGIGYADYQTKFYQNNKNIVTEKGWTLGMLLSAGYEIALSEMTAIYFQASLNGGVVTTITETDEITGRSFTYSTDDVNDGVGLGRFNLSIGFRFAK